MYLDTKKLKKNIKIILNYLKKIKNYIKIKKKIKNF